MLKNYFIVALRALADRGQVRVRMALIDRDELGPESESDDGSDIAGWQSSHPPARERIDAE